MEFIFVQDPTRLEEIISEGDMLNKEGSIEIDDSLVENIQRLKQQYRF